MRVLYIEDTDSDADLAQRALARHAPHVALVRACTLDEGRRWLANDAFDALLLDLNLPDGSGLELLAELRRQGVPLPAIVLTSAGDQDVVAAAIRAGADDYLAKHDDYLQRLAQRIEQACAHRQEAGGVARRGLSVLYAEHNPFDADQARHHLAQHAPHIRLEHAADAADVLLRLPAGEDAPLPFDVLLLDDRLPGMGGLELARLLRQEHGRDLPIVLVTGHGNEELAASALRFGLDDYLCKRDGYLFQLAGTLERVHHQAELAREGARLRETSGRLTQLLAASPTLLYTLAIDGRRLVATWVSENIERLLGYTVDEALAPDWWRRNVHADDREQAMVRTDVLLAAGQRTLEYRFMHRDGRLCWVHDEMRVLRDETGRPVEIVGSWTDISASKHSEQRLEHLYHYDPLTDLPNRLLLQSRLEHALDHARRHRQLVAVLCIDLDRFKNVNDSLGHPVGDEVIVHIARRLKDGIGDDDTLGRLGGDEFLVIMENLASPEAAGVLAHRIIGLVEQPIRVSSGHEVVSSASVGISLHPADGDLVTQLLQHADAALYRAKEEGRGIAQFYLSALTSAANERLELELQLRRALERDEFEVFYQPLISLDPACDVVGAEALLRWRQGHGGLVSPDRFIPLAEDTGLIVAIGEWVLREACAQARAWIDAGLPFGRIAVNLSVRQFREHDIVGLVAAVLADTGLPAVRLELEITESALMRDVDEAVAKLDALRALGVGLAVDDFGTGYSSLAYLKRFPLDKLKIDQSFIRGMGPGSNDEAIVTATIAMAHSLALQTLAEGVETEDQLEILRALGCDAYQGYIASRPVPAREFNAFLMQPAPG
ncbi:MAG TPA: EAL domain-containing protein [Rhodocyclaceae bacterium]|nr:EAL domain-containing protein [Rhodocyclaceae bacterium]